MSCADGGPAGDTPRKVVRWSTDTIHTADHGGFVAYDDYLTLENELRAARADLEACGADAERYRVAVNMASMGKLPESWKEGYTEAECTAAIDAAQREGS